MKQKDILLVIVIIIVSAVFSFILTSVLFGSPETRKEKVEVIETITDKFDKPDSKFFNEKSVNPTKLIRIEENQNQQPFNKSQ